MAYDASKDMLLWEGPRKGNLIAQIRSYSGYEPKLKFFKEYTKNGLTSINPSYGTSLEEYLYQKEYDHIILPILEKKVQPQPIQPQQMQQQNQPYQPGYNPNANYQQAQPQVFNQPQPGGFNPQQGFGQQPGNFTTPQPQPGSFNPQQGFGQPQPGGFTPQTNPLQKLHQY